MKTETCIVGSGVAGAIVAAELLERSKGGEVVMVEAGAEPGSSNRRRWLDYVTAGTPPFREHAPTKDEYQSVGGFAYDLTGNQLLVRGGTTVHWAGWSYRLRPEDFERRKRTGEGVDWPISYQDLEPFYARAETILRVAGDADDPGHPPRSTPFPLPAFPYQASDRPFLEAMETLGYGAQHHCTARNTVEIDGQPRCQGIGTCTLCPVDARFSADQIVRQLEQNPRFRLLTRTTALRFMFSSRKRADRLVVLDQASGKEKPIEAERFVVCGGGIYSPKLLLQSKSRQWSEGLGNDNGLVGRYLMNHLLAQESGTHPSNPKRLFQETGEVLTAASRHFDSPEMQAGGKFIMTHLVQPGRAVVPLMAGGAERDEIIASTTGPYTRAIWILLEQKPSAENRVELGGGTDRFGQPTTRISFDAGQHALKSVEAARGHAEAILRAAGCTDVKPGFLTHVAHHMGTCRMSSSDSAGVVDPDLKVHGTDNVFVCSSATFPTGGCANPTLTIAALALRLGAALAPKETKANTRSGPT